jgi:hypothetical protein
MGVPEKKAFSFSDPLGAAAQKAGTSHSRQASCYAAVLVLRPARASGGRLWRFGRGATKCLLHVPGQPRLLVWDWPGLFRNRLMIMIGIIIGARLIF